MGRLILPEASLIYVDANAVIYRVERLEPYFSRIAPIWESLDQGICQLLTSELTLLEVLVKPIRDQDWELADFYRDLMFSTNLQSRSIDREVLERAAELRADLNLKTPDSIHAATALLSR